VMTGWCWDGEGKELIAVTRAEETNSKMALGTMMSRDNAI